MKAIYLDNFRGFSNQLIALKEVNFLVGENSTGKTSFLAAVKVLGSPKFWFRPSFDDPDLPFSTFSEITSKSALDKKYFSIGYFSDEKPKRKHNLFRLLRFKDLNGFPAIDKYCFLVESGVVISEIREGTIKYKLIKDCPESVVELANLCNEEMDASRFKGAKIMRNKNFSRAMLFANAQNIVEADLVDGLKDDVEFSFNIGMDGPVCKWIAPIRAKPEKIYLGGMPGYSSEGAHIPYLLNKILKAKAAQSDKKLLALVNEFGKNSGLFEAVKVKRFGNEVLAPFEINVDIGGNSLVLGSVGYGVSQVLPIILEATRQNSSAYTAIQQPEVHLHPKAQAALGEFLFQCNMEKKIQYLIETHSDFLIDRFRLCMNRSEYCCSAQVLFFERVEHGNSVHSIEIDEDGRYPVDQPEAFRAFFLNEEMSMLRV